MTLFSCALKAKANQGPQRFGNAIVPSGTMNLRQRRFSHDFNPILDGCCCLPCRPKAEGGLEISRAFIHHITNKETVGAHLLTMHNVTYLLELVGAARLAILEQRFPAWVKRFFQRRFPLEGETINGEGRYPTWAVTALREVGIDMMHHDDGDAPYSCLLLLMLSICSQSTPLDAHERSRFLFLGLSAWLL